MPCYTDYIGIDRTTTSRSGLYATDLPGVEISLLEGLTKEDQDDYLELHDMIVARAWTNMVSDISIALQNKFIVDSKIVNRMTSDFQSGVNESSGLAGIKAVFDLPRYARVHVSTIEVFANQAYDSPDWNLRIYDTDENGELLYEQGHTLAEGRNKVNVDTDFEVDNLFFSFTPSEVQLRKTENKNYPGYYLNWDRFSCTFPYAWPYTDYRGTITQVNGGGLNVNYSVVCSIDKFVCENINLFKTAFWYRYGVELCDERLLGNRLNRFTTMTSERATELSGYFGGKYTQNITEATKSQNIPEDPICFKCKTVAMAKTVLP